MGLVCGEGGDYLHIHETSNTKWQQGVELYVNHFNNLKKHILGVSIDVIDMLECYCWGN